MEKSNVERRREVIINVIYYTMLLAFFYLFCKYALWLFLPIIISFIVAIILQKPVRAIARKTPIKKGPASVICVLLLLVVGVSLIFLIGLKAINYLKDFANYLAGLFDNTQTLVDNIQNWCLGVSAKLPDSVSNLLTKNITEIFSNLNTYLSADEAQAIAETTGNTASAGTSGLSIALSWIKTPLISVLSTAKQIPSVLASFLISLVASCFLTADYDRISAFLANQLSTKRRSDVERAKHLLKTSFLKMVKAYCIIILITFSEMFIGLSVLRLIGVYKSAYIIIIAAATALVDIVPVLGTGTVVIPWALYSLITGNIGLAIGLGVLYAVITVLRQIIEPKLVAGQLGLPPFVTIIGMFIGLKLFGVLGMLIMPIVIIMLKLLNDEEIIHLWKSSIKINAEKEADAKAKSGEENVVTEEAEKDT